MPSGVLARSDAAEKATADERVERDAAEKAARDAAEKADAEKAARDAAEKAAAEKAAREAAEKAAAEKAGAAKAAQDKAAAAKAAQDKAAAAKAVQDKAAAGKSAPAPSTPNIKTPPPSQAIVVDPSAEKIPDVSRSVAVTAGSRFELPFEGSGWTYLGERTGKDGVRYDGRRFDGASIVFSLTASKEGEYVLRFQRQDALRGISYEEHVGVKVSPRGSAAAGASVGVSPVGAAVTAASGAPSSGGAGQTAAAGQTAVPEASGAAPSSTSGAALPDTPEGMLLYAREQLAAGKPQSAIEALDRFFVRYPAGMDEAFYLYGLALEQSGPLKDIKRALSFYKIVRDDYPESPFWDKATARISYIERHYFDIR